MGSQNSQPDPDPDEIREESTESGPTEDTAESQPDRLSLSRRAALASVAGLGSLGLLSGSAQARHRGQHWKGDTDAEGNKLFNLNALEMIETENRLPRYGTTDDTALRGVVNNERFLRVAPTATAEAPNIVGGHGANSASEVVGATIAGGGQGQPANPNTVDANYGTIGGGKDNTASGLEAVIGGGEQNTASAENATVAGGDDNTASGVVATVGGGGFNTASDEGATVGGGEFNDALALFATIAGGGPSNPKKPDATNNAVYDQYGTIGGGGFNQAGTADDDATTARFATVGGGFSNHATGGRATVAGGNGNEASGVDATVAGGVGNEASGEKATVSGGALNDALAKFATIAGGGPTVSFDPTKRNVVYDRYGTIGGGGNNQAGTDDGDPNTAQFATVAGGKNNMATGPLATIGGGVDNEASNTWATVGGGGNNDATDIFATVSGGEHNRALASWATIAGGGPTNITDKTTSNRVFDDYGTIGGGGDNQAGTDDDDPTTAKFATVGGGLHNEASGRAATVPGGRNNTASGDNSFAAGREARTNGHDGAFVWGDSSSTPIGASNDDEVVFQAPGGFAIRPGLTPGTGNTVHINFTTGELLDATASSARYKTNIEPLATDTSAVLDLDPRTFEYEETGDCGVGFVAEEVEKTFQELVVYDEAGRPDGVQYDRLGVYLVPEVRKNRDRVTEVERTAEERRARIDELATELDAKDARIADQCDRIDRLESAVDRKNARIDDLEAENEGLRERLSAVEDRLTSLEAGQSSPAAADD